MAVRLFLILCIKLDVSLLVSCQAKFPDRYSHWKQMITLRTYSKASKSLQGNKIFRPKITLPEGRTQIKYKKYPKSSQGWKLSYFEKEQYMKSYAPQGNSENTGPGKWYLQCVTLSSLAFLLVLVCCWQTLCVFIWKHLYFALIHEKYFH